MDRAIELSCDKLVWYRETIKTKKSLRVHTEDNNIFTMHRTMHVVQKCIMKRFYPSAHRGNATGQVRPLMLLAFGELHISVDVTTLYVRCVCEM